MPTVLSAVRACVDAAIPARDVRVALLGVGNVGSAIAELAARRHTAAPCFSIVSALVRNLDRPRPVHASRIPLTTDPLAVLKSRPDVVVDVLGGIEPARTLVRAALSQSVPVVTANKSLLAAHGNELFDLAATTGTALLYEASVLAGVPFLGTFHRRPLARDLTAISGIVNGTTNFILSRMLCEHVSFADALREAQRVGYAEPDPAKDVNGDDAAEKLCVLVRHFAECSIEPAEVERTSIAEVDPEDLRHAVTFGGRIRPLAMAEWNADAPAHADRDGLTAFVGPAFVGNSNGLAHVDGVQNAVALRTVWSGNLFFSGPGAGPAITAATVLDDVFEACAIAQRPLPNAHRPAICRRPHTGWFVRVMSTDLRDEQQAPALLATLGVRMRRTSSLVKREGTQRQWMLTHSCAREHLSAAIDILAARTRAHAWMIRAIE